MKKHLSFLILTGLFISTQSHAVLNKPDSDIDLVTLEAKKLEKLLDPNNKKTVWKRSKQQFVPYDQRDLSCWGNFCALLGTMQGTPFTKKLFGTKKQKSE